MKSVYGLVAVSMLMAACGGGAPAEPESSIPPQMPYGNLAQVMRAIPFPNSNIIFDAQVTDPGAPPEETGGAGASAQYNNIYGGWQAVVNAGVALQETANLLKIPGRSCENGRPVPLDNEDFQGFIQGLVDAGAAAIAAGQAEEFDEDRMFELGNTMADACAACHEVYRDKDDDADRCIQ